MKTTPVTIKEWLETLPEPYRHEALKESEWNQDMPVNSLKDALECFSWSGSPQMYDYWKELYNSLE